MDSIIKILSTELNTPEKFIENVVSLIDEGNTIPFIARYRKELHGGMDDTALRTLEDRLGYLRNLEKRREEVKSSIAAQEKLTDELSSAIDNASTLAEIEDIYRPFRPKRRTRATMAKEKGLEGLATALLEQSRECPAPAVLAEEFINPDLGVETVEEAIEKFGSVPVGSFVYMWNKTGQEKVGYKDQLGDAHHVGIYCGNDIVRDSSRSKKNGKYVRNGVGTRSLKEFNRVTLFSGIDYSSNNSYNSKVEECMSILDGVRNKLIDLEGILNDIFRS